MALYKSFVIIIIFFIIIIIYTQFTIDDSKIRRLWTGTDREREA